MAPRLRDGDGMTRPTAVLVATAALAAWPAQAARGQRALMGYLRNSVDSRRSVNASSWLGPLGKLETRAAGRGPAMPWTAAASPALSAGAEVPARLSWSASEMALAGAFTAALLIDAGQTRRLARGGWRDHHESNPLLGPRPSVGHVNSYTALVGLTVLGVSAALPARLRSCLLGGALAVEVFAIAGTARQGIAVKIL